MSPDSPQAKEVRKTIEQLIEGASSNDSSVLDRIYHDDMDIFMLAPGGEVQRANKDQFKAQVIAKTNEAAKPQTWAKYHVVEADEERGHVVISRKVNLTDETQIITLSIDLVLEDGRWQIIREVISLS
ncbi:MULTISPECIES: nuclear transport factor 2 family protein [unclassified Ruegeria]|uniref:nuclear transport factor 2 family protein n=1 Tax=unclassified Ruegeria TaxID=2625375 RepID=UPI001488A7C6|nr:MULTISPECIES: nuclear transport factor 2 family protein [unclassified Ruegeria]